MTEQVIHESTQSVLVTDLKRADSFFKRLIGLMFTRELAQSHGLLISPCQQIHTQFMHYAVDVMFLDANNKVLHIERAMKPWRFSKFHKQAKHVLEVNAGAASMVSAGDTLHFQS
ncbi:DUF192 domain-containing protein [Methylophilus aquaticus]|uniref:DUF192 domain-containing protein n=1 Tax=Methylophilus aquaticus TaxID=1971610 RepID=A0ABT9JP77_9PROT|nr:DUF192 domain-containing protein [Methylophilus aquaticus]MDP8566392.1 DUF192 domain-containing protein [Methylophilus aquaticus]